MFKLPASMKINYQQLPLNLKQKITKLYVLVGTEHLLLQENQSLIINAVKTHGYSEQINFQIETGFEWEKLYLALHAKSMFSDKTLIKLQFTDNQLKENQDKSLLKCIENLQDDKILLIVVPKSLLEIQRKAWFKIAENIGLIVQIWAISEKELPGWTRQRFQRLGMKVSNDAIEFLVSNLSGNLLAAAQEIDKLHLLYGSKPIGLPQLMAVISDQARYVIFDFIDYALQGNKEKAIRILRNLQETKCEPTLLLWIIVKELNELAKMAFAIEHGQPLAPMLTKLKLKRQSTINKALQRLSYKKIGALLHNCAQIDRMIKGLEPGNVWTEFENIV